MKLGVEYGKVSLAPHDENWKVIAGETIGKLREILGDTAISIQHVGSTSILGIPAKPIIDIAVGVADPKCVYQFEEPLLKAEIHIVGELVPGQIMCDIKTPEGLEGQHIHFVTYDCQAWKEYIRFRDYLNAVPEQAKRYADLKLELVRKYADDRKSYTGGKAELITELLKRAAEWSEAKDGSDE